jgi:UDP-N-acetylmuramate dehydrogenase
MTSLKKYNTYSLDSEAKDVYLPRSIKEIIEIYRKHKCVVILGNGSNVILAKRYYKDTAFLIFKDNFKKIREVQSGIYAESGVLLRELSLYAYNNSLSGVETFFDIPSSIGGAMIMNTGAYGDEIYDHLLYVKVLDVDKNGTRYILKNDISYGYRHSMLKKTPYIVLGACFSFERCQKDKIKQKMDDILTKRKLRLPINQKSAGSVFKRPVYYLTVGEMVEKIGLRGYQIGGAEIAKTHGGIIVNNGSATGKDLLNLIKFIRKEVYSSYKVRLSLEQIIIT